MRKLGGRGMKRSELSHTSRFTLQTSRSSGGWTRTITRLLNREPPYHWATPDFAKRPVGVEPTLPPWQGSRLPLHHGRKNASLPNCQRSITPKRLKSTEPESNPHHPARDGGVLPLDHQCLFQIVSSGIGENRTHIARIKSPMHYLVCHNPMCCCRCFVSVGVAGIEPATVAL